MNTDKMFPSRFLKAGDLPEEGALPVTIEKITVEEIGPRRDQKPVIHFEELDKALVCNKTNANTITKLTGSKETDDWIGKTILLHRAEVEFQGEMVESIRVSLKRQEAKHGHKHIDDDGDEIPF